MYIHFVKSLTLLLGFETQRALWNEIIFHSVTVNSEPISDSVSLSGSILFIN